MTELEQRLLTTIRASGTAWQTRAQIAESIGRKQLTNYGLTRLELLLHRGFIETRKTKGKSTRPQYEYRAVVNG